MRALFFNVSLTGHVKPTIGLVSEMIDAGWDVDYYSTKKYKSDIVSSGANFISIDEYENYDLKMEPIAYSYHLLDTTAKLLPILLSDVERKKPDLIISDFLCVWGHLVSKVSGIRSVTINSSMAVTPDMLSPAALMFLSCFNSVRKLKLYILYQFLWLNIRNKYKKSPPRINLIPGQSSDMNLVLTTDLLQSNIDLIDKYKYCFVGMRSMRVQRGYTEKENWIYVSLGTVYDNFNVIKKLVRALKYSQYKVVISLGGNADSYNGRQLIESVKEAKNINIFNYVDQDEILSRASLFITHGGMNSVNESIASETPMLLVPQAADQFMIAKRVVELNLGLRMKKEDVESKDTLLNKMDFIINDQSVKASMAKAKRSLTELSKSKKYLLKLESYVL